MVNFQEFSMSYEEIFFSSLFAQPFVQNLRNDLFNPCSLLFIPIRIAVTTEGRFFFFVLFRAVPVAYGGSLGVKLELQPLVYSTATAMQDPNPSLICNLHHSSW